METSSFAPAATTAAPATDVGPSSSVPAAPSLENIHSFRAPNEIPPRTSSQHGVTNRTSKSFLKAPHETDWMAQGIRPTTAAPALASQTAIDERKPSRHVKHSSLPLNNHGAAKQQHQQHQQHQQNRQTHNNQHHDHNHSSSQHHPHPSDPSSHDFYLLKNNGIGSHVNGSGYQSEVDSERLQRHQRRQNRQHHQQQQVNDSRKPEYQHSSQHHSRISPPPKEPFRGAAADLPYRQNPEWTREKDKVVLAPYEYLLVHPGKDIRSRSIVAFNAFLRVPDESLKVIKRVVGMLHTASLLIDDVEDSSVLRRGVPVAHSIFGIPQTINSANYVYFLALKELSLLQNATEAIGIYTDELVNLHRGQGMDLFWRDTLTCPSEADYLEMVGNKTGGLFRLAVKLMQVESATEIDCVPLVNTIGLLFQIQDDYQNLHPSSAQSLSKGTTCEDLTEGKFSFPIIHAIRADPASHLLQNILRQRTADPDVKRYAVDYLERVGSFAYTRRVLRDLSKRSMMLIDELEGRMEGLSSISEGLVAAEKKPSDTPVERSNADQNEHLPIRTLEETIVIPNSASNINPSILPVKTDGKNKDITESRKNKHVKIGHGVRQILEKLKVDMPKPNTANATHIASLVAADKSSAAFTMGTNTGDYKTADNVGSSAVAASPPTAAKAEAGSDAETAHQMPLASSPSTPMAMTELPTTETPGIDGSRDQA